MHFFLILPLCALLSLPAPTEAAEADDIPFSMKSRPVVDASVWYISDGWSNGPHQACEWRRDAVQILDNKNLRLTLSDKGGKIRPTGCGEIQTNERYGFGRYEARIKSAAGSGLNSAFFTFIGPPNKVKTHDEIDFEFLGKNSHTVQVSYWHDAKNYDIKIVDLGFDASADFHDYAFEWTPTHITWYADGKIIHKTSGNHPMPVNPGKIFFSLWAGSKTVNDWLGPFTYSIPKTMDVENVTFTPHGN